MISLEDFKNDPQGKRFSDVLKDNRIDFQDVINFFNKPEITRRMEDSELHHERTPLAGIVKEFERLDSVANFLGGYDAHTTQRFRQAIGALIRIHMEALGWKTTGRKGSLGVRAKAIVPIIRWI